MQGVKVRKSQKFSGLNASRSLAAEKSYGIKPTRYGLLSGRDFDSRDYQESIAEDSFAKLKEGVLEFVGKTNFQRYLMIVKSTGIISPAMIRSQNVLNFGYALYLLLRSKGEDAAVIEKVVRRWIVLAILTGRYSGSPESTFDYDIKRFQANNPMEFLEHTEAGELSDAFWNNILVTKLNTSVASSPMFHVFLMSQVKMGDCGFLSEQIDVKSLIEQRGDIHHIFPKKYLQKCGIKERGLYNQIANYVYTQSEINVKSRIRLPKTTWPRSENSVRTGIPFMAVLTLWKSWKSIWRPTAFLKKFLIWIIPCLKIFWRNGVA